MYIYNFFIQCKKKKTLTITSANQVNQNQEKMLKL